MVISEELAFNIDNLIGNGNSLRSVSKELGISKSKVSRYVNGEEKIILNSSDKSPQKPSNSEYDSIEVSREDIQEYREQIEVLLQEFRGEVFREMREIKKKVEQLQRAVDYTNKHLWHKDNRYSNPEGYNIGQQVKDQEI